MSRSLFKPSPDPDIGKPIFAARYVTRVLVCGFKLRLDCNLRGFVCPVWPPGVVVEPDVFPGG